MRLAITSLCVALLVAGILAGIPRDPALKIVLNAALLVVLFTCKHKTIDE